MNLAKNNAEVLRVTINVLKWIPLDCLFYTLVHSVSLYSSLTSLTLTQNGFHPRCLIVFVTHSLIEAS
jgi:hypothetical protein